MPALLKDSYTADTLQTVGNLCLKANLPIDTQAWHALSSSTLAPLAYKERVDLLATRLVEYGNFDFNTFAEKFVSVLPEPLPTAQGTFIQHSELAIVAKYVEMQGLPHEPQAFALMEALTQRHTCEFAIRPFLLNSYAPTYEQMKSWASHESFHVRRLASEGLRPFLPWSFHLPMMKKDPLPIVPVLQKLVQDKSPYVRLSVSNNINDMSKIMPGLALAVCRAWQPYYSEDKNVQKVIVHGLRTLVKAHNPRATAIVEKAKTAIEDT